MLRRRLTAYEPQDDKVFLVHEDILPEALLKTIQVKQLLAQGEVKTVHEAVEKVGLSRSAFYKYKDGIHVLNRMERERIVTISFDLQHRSGMLSKVLSMIAASGGNVLTINQTIPLQGMANVVMTVETSNMEHGLPRLMEELSEEEGVRRAAVIGQG